ncbi:DUF302 domain-containing protein [Dethiothermospora halolimnae]|uniref:DUF302 domain-containing protein n=1 Tax=Dethiothermospora halolimnae TaxID=3114390 RepID=UPI003CCC1A6E
MKIIYEVKVEKEFGDAIDALKKSLSEHNFGVLWELNFKDKLKEKGLDFDTNFKVFEVCNPKQAKEVLESHIEVGYFLPCKMVIYEKNNSVYVGMLRPTDLIGMFNDDSLVSIAKEVEKELKAAIDAI